MNRRCYEMEKTKGITRKNGFYAKMQAFAEWRVLCKEKYWK